MPTFWAAIYAILVDNITFFLVGLRLEDELREEGAAAFPKPPFWAPLREGGAGVVPKPLLVAPPSPRLSASFPLMLTVVRKALLTGDRAAECRLRVVAVLGAIT